MYTSILCVNQHPVLFKAWKKLEILQKEVAVGTCPALFNTKAHQARKKQHEVLTSEFVELIQEAIGQKEFIFKHIDEIEYSIIWKKEVAKNKV